MFDQEEAADTGLNALLLDEYKLDPFEHGTCVSAVRLFDESQDSIDAHNEGSRVTVVPPRTTIRGRNLIAVGTTTMPFRGEVREICMIHVGGTRCVTSSFQYRSLYENTGSYNFDC